MALDPVRLTPTKKSRGKVNFSASLQRPYSSWNRKRKVHSCVFFLRKTLNLFISRCAEVPNCKTLVLKALSHWANYYGNFSRLFLKPLLSGSLCKLWKHRFSVPGLVSPPPPPPCINVFILTDLKANTTAITSNRVTVASSHWSRFCVVLIKLGTIVPFQAGKTPRLVTFPPSKQVLIQAPIWHFVFHHVHPYPAMVGETRTTTDKTSPQLRRCVLLSAHIHYRESDRGH